MVKAMMKDDPAIEAVREARHHISEMFGHEPRKLIEYYGQFQGRHRERLISQPTPQPKAEDEDAA